MKLIKSKFFWGVLIVAGFAIVYLFFRLNPSEKSVEYVTQKAEIGTVVQTVAATGQVKSASEIDLNFRNAGTVAAVNVRSGDAVFQGDILIQLVAADLAADVNRARADLSEAQSNLDRIVAGATVVELDVARAALDQAATSLANAQTDAASTQQIYQQILENELQNSLVAANTALTKASIALQKVDDTFNYNGDEDNFVTYNKPLEAQVETGYSVASSKVDLAFVTLVSLNTQVSEEQIDGLLSETFDALLETEQTVEDLAVLLNYVIVNSVLTQTALDTLRDTINTQRTTIDTQIDGLKQQQQALVDARINLATKVETANNAITAARKALSKAEADLALSEAPARPEDVTLYQARVRREQANLTIAQERYEETILRAPIDGVITKVNLSVGEQALRDITTPVIQMLAAENYEIEVNIPESDITKIEVGHEVTITLDAFSDEEVFTGTVTTINPAQTEIQDVVYYQVTVSFSQHQPVGLEDAFTKIKPGMTANVTVNAQRRDNVVTIPLRAVKEREGQRIVEILEAGYIRELPVEIGLRGDGGMIEIISGVTVGQEVITFTREK
ncbi:MAG: hypothetical protein A2840_02135 [Candidatus Buchananbacteria bacterium RIFCSPHIGHO2_01_FULL_47_11b]|uniref:AprE-like beta-barrel domain-containing protein n=1 Tax=Candidatus Buchananbacteria bacterium RIFCSPHIGHO2_01_FULL_47_11b TaxID=1797537 RepID=A0A1G1Y8H5_9BACT|nr:MAG: hypothetical protein A2840_02135 [Candidatus Buchananbacteria bacterium RIFCSPHIGHO2_01_FULL_47_11b]